MTKIDIQVPQDHIAKATICIANLKILHLLNVRKIPLGQIDLESQQDIVLRTKYKQLKHQLEELSQTLGFELAPPTDSHLKNLDPYRDIITLEKDLQEKDADIKAVLAKIKGQEEVKREKEELLHLLEMIFNLGIDLSQFHQNKFLYCAVGLMPAENIERLEFSLSTIYHILLPSSSLGKRRLGFILASKKDEEKIEKALNSAYFKKLDLSVLKEGLDEVKCRDIQREIQDIAIDMNLTEDYLKKLKKPAEKKLRELYKKIYISLMILDAARSFNKVGNNYNISGWIPQEIIPVLEKKLQEDCPKDAQITMAPLDLEKKEIRKNGNKIPTYLKNPFFLKPFERLIFGYDIPDYHEVEPTFFFALSFLLMFGVMFGDVGHGLVLFFGGLFAFKRIKSEVAAQIGLIAMECGFMSTIFGFLYGSIFGFEHIFPALWFHPMGNIGIIVVEGLVVSIQTIRLEYYEFFSKFFKGGDELYKPLKNVGNQ
jgi:V/A-type H+-transporting ATPase subunit I